MHILGEFLWKKHKLILMDVAYVGLLNCPNNSEAMKADTKKPIKTFLT